MTDGPRGGWDYDFYPSVTDPEVLRVGAARPEWWFRRQVARNPHTPPDVLASLCCDEALEVRLAAATNPRTPREAAEEVHRRMEACAASHPEWEYENNPCVCRLADCCGDPPVVRRELCPECGEEVCADCGARGLPSHGT